METKQTQPNEHLLCEATIAFEAKGHLGPPSAPAFFKASSLIQLLELVPSYRVNLTGETVWLS